MSDEESDLESEGYSGYDLSSFSEAHLSAEKRAHHNALERKRRDHIKDRFNSLKDAIPDIRHEKSVNKLSVSRAQILKKAAEYIQHMKEQHSTFNAEIEALKRQNSLLESQCQHIERQRYGSEKNIFYDS